ncbi:MAG: ABC transporter permease [Eubacteriales bacterium]|nr:ABC transporter permease [Eubacteriales bacterium]MDD4390471.1 ABC transporter permease [Eubacteriales bacterium]
MKRTLNFIQKTLIFVVILLAWYLVCRAGLWSTYALPTPAKVWDSLLQMTANGEILSHLFISIRRIVIGFTISCLITFVLTLIGALMPKATPYYSQLLEVMRHIPPISLIPLLILWFGIGELPKIIVIVLATLFPVLLNTENGIFGCDKKLIEVGKMLSFSKFEMLFRIMIPNAVPDILVGIRIGLGYAWRAIIGAEMIAASSGIGYLILDAQALSRTDKVIAGILVIGVFGLLTDLICSKMVKFTSRNRSAEVKDGRI